MSRTALWYSARFKRWNVSVRPGFGRAAAAASSCVLEPRDESVLRGLIGPRPAGRRHQAAAQLADDLLPDLGVAADGGDIEGVEGQVGCLEARVVARHAVAVEDRPLRCRRGTLGLRCGAD